MSYILSATDDEYQIVIQILKLLRDSKQRPTIYQITLNQDHATFTQIAPAVAPKGVIKLK